MDIKQEQKRLLDRNWDQLISRWRIDPIDLWRRQAQARQYVCLARQVTDGDRVVRRVADLLLADGYRVEITGGNDHVDLIVNERAKLEVKFSRWHWQAEGRGRYQANIRPVQGQAADLVIFVARNEVDHIFVLPPEVAGRSITIRTYDPEVYLGKYAPYLNGWDLLKDVLGIPRVYQFTLPFIFKETNERNI